MCAWGLAGAALKIGGSVFNTMYNSHSAKKAAAASYAYNIASMNHQYGLTRKLNQNAYQDTTKSMRDAGINPMLAINQGINGLSAGAGANISQQAAQSDIDLASAMELKNDTDRVENERARVKNETETKDSTVALNKAAEAKANEEARATKIANDFAPKLQAAQLNNIEAQTQNQRAQGASALTMAKNNTAMTNSNIGLNAAKGLEASANTDYTKERSRGYTDSVSLKGGPISYSKTTTGNGPNNDLGSNSAKNYEIKYETINGHQVPVKVYNSKWHTEYEYINGKKVPVKVRN